MASSGDAIYTKNIPVVKIFGMKRILLPPALLAAAMLLVEHPTVATDGLSSAQLNYRPSIQSRGILRLRGGITKEAEEVGEPASILLNVF